MERKWTSEDAYGNPITQALDICLFNPPNRTVCKSPSIQHPWKKKTLTSWAQHDTLEETIAFDNKRKSLLVIQIKLKDLKPLFSRKESLTFQKRSSQRKCSCIGGQILRTRINNNHWKPTIPSSQYETNLWSTHVNIIRLAEPITRCVRWRTQVFKIERFVCKGFLPSPPPPPTFIFWLVFHFSRGQNRESCSSVCLSLWTGQTESLFTG